MPVEDRLPDDALVVRGGRPPFPNAPLQERCNQHPDGHHGFSVKCGVGLTIAELAVGLRYTFVGVTTVGEIRRLGYEVVRTRGFAYHATVVVPENWEPGAAEQLARLFQEERNPTSRQSQ